jgi:hypothetical protein
MRVAIFEGIRRCVMKAIMHGGRWEMEKAAELLKLLADSRILLVCGVLSSLVYIAAHVIVPMQYPGYSVVDQTVSELAAIGAPTRELWVMLMVPFVVFLVAFGIGVWKVSFSRTTTPSAEAAATPPKQGGEPGGIADRGFRIADFESAAFDQKTVSRNLRVVGVALVMQAVVGFVWPPMHMRGAETSLTDTLHVAFVLLVVPLMVIEIWFSRVVVGKMFAIATLIVLIAFGVITAFYGPNIPKNLPTPWVGVWERIGIAAWAVWLLVFSVRLISPHEERTTASAEAAPTTL